MTKALKLFRFEDKPLNVETDMSGDVWFNASDVCRALKLSNVTMALRSLDDDEKGLRIIETLGGDQEINCISEPGLYKMISRSRKPEARRFDRWVRHEVLPAIRKTGSYGAEAETIDPMAFLNDPAAMRAALLGYTEKVIALESVNAELAPKAAAHDHFAELPGELGVRDAGRELKVGQTWVCDYIDAHGWSCVEGKKRKPAHYGLQKEYVRFVRKAYLHPHTGEETVSENFRITQKGINRLAEIIAGKKKSSQPTVRIVQRPFSRPKERAS